MCDHVKKCKDRYADLLEGNDPTTGRFEPCFSQEDTHLPKEGHALSTGFTYELEKDHENTKTVNQLIAEFTAKAQEEVKAV